MTRHMQFLSDGVDARHGALGRRVARLLAILVPLVVLLASASSAAAENRVENTFTCHNVTWTYSEFPEGVEVKTVERIKIDKKVVSTTLFNFIGPSAISTVNFNVPAGHHEIGATSEYRYGSVFKEHDQFLKGGITCESEPNYTIVKRQMIAGSGKPFTTEELTGAIGQVVDYQMVVTNTGNVPLFFNNFTDPNCDNGTIAGGPGTEPVQPGKSTTFTCNHKLTKVGHYPNTATVTGKVPAEFCASECETTKSSNTVVVVVPIFSIEKFQEIAGSGSGYTKSQLAAEVGQTVNYKITVTNVSEVPETFTNFTDEKCDGGTIAGGPGAFPVLPGESTSWTCTHLVTEADKEAGLIINTGTVTGTPEGGEPETRTSNPVVVEVPVPKPKVSPKVSCRSVTFEFSGFAQQSNTVVERIYDNGKLISTTKFTFNGPTGSNTVLINLGPGSHHISTTVEFTVNGKKGEHDQGFNVTCTAEPEFTLEKKQRIAHTGLFTTSPISGHVGLTVEYVIIAKNTGNVPLKFGSLEDPSCPIGAGPPCSGVEPEGCDTGTITGGPGTAAVPPEGPKSTGKTEWKCTHVLTEEDRAFGRHGNQATVTGTPEAEPPKTHTSNLVFANVS